MNVSICLESPSAVLQSGLEGRTARQVGCDEL